MQKLKYLELLDKLKASRYKNRTQSLCCFNAKKGSEYNNNLMVVGRAVNGWCNEFKLCDLDTVSMVEQIFNQHDSTCPLQWVEDSWGRRDGYSTKSSAFWRVIKDISQRLNKLESCTGWANKIVWSNLYKIAPSNKGNPSESLSNEQFSLCNELLFTEIKEYQPKVILFFAGLNWFNGFLNDSIYLEKGEDSALVEAHGSLDIDNKKIIIIVAKHPQGKPEANMVNEIMNVIS